jgi:hypothetical protein
MVDTLGKHGIGASRVVVKPKLTNAAGDAVEGYVINRWEFGVPNSPVIDYPFGNVRLAGGANPILKENGVWRYNWDTTDVAHKTGKEPDTTTGRGQGNTIPVALFADHALVRIGSENKLYDPSYGTGPFVGTTLNTALLAWEDASVAGFVRLTAAASVRPAGRAEDVIRRNIVGVLESEI